jgi:hypothetical protein
MVYVETLICESLQCLVARSLSLRSVLAKDPPVGHDISLERSVDLAMHEPFRLAMESLYP